MVRLKKVTILVNYNLYESKRYFTQKFAEALRRKGIMVNIVDSQNIQGELPSVIVDPNLTDLTCSFNSSSPRKDGLYLWDITHIPHWSILVDPAFYSRQYLASPYSIISCVDHFDCAYVQRNKFENVFFWGHAVEPELSAPENNERPYDVVFLGSCYDHESLRKYWQEKLPNNVSAALDEAIEIVLADRMIPLIEAVQIALENNKLTLSQTDYNEIIFCVDSYMRGKDRTELIRSIKNAHVHVFGGTCWRQNPSIRGWGHTLAAMPNVSIHPAIPFAESLEILKQSKICLNSMPFFKNGTHERIFTGLACGAVPITTDNLWVQDHFLDGKELLLYRPNHWEAVNDQVNELLSKETSRKKIAAQGREKVMKEHTWDNRVEEMFTALNPILNKIKA